MDPWLVSLTHDRLVTVQYKDLSIKFIVIPITYNGNMILDQDLYSVILE